METRRYEVSGRAAGGVISVMTTELDALAASGAAAISSTIVNSAERDILADLFLSVTFGVAPAAGKLNNLYLVRSYDDTTFEDAVASATPASVVRPQNGLVGAFAPRAVTTAQVMCVPAIAISPGDHQWLLANDADQAYPASGSVLRAKYYREAGAQALNRTLVSITGSLVTTATTANQVIATYTVTAGKTLWLMWADSTVRLTTAASTATLFGTHSLEMPSGTKRTLWTQQGAGQGYLASLSPSEPIPLAAGSVIRIVCTPAAVTSYTWAGSIFGHEISNT